MIAITVGINSYSEKMMKNATPNDAPSNVDESGTQLMTSINTVTPKNIKNKKYNVEKTVAIIDKTENAFVFFLGVIS